MTAVDDRPTTGGELGKARLRKEDQRLITGRTKWTDNITLPGMLHLAFVRSPYAHARITSIDTTAAKASPNVVTILTGADLDAEQGSLPCAWPITDDMKAPRHPAVAVDHVAFAGEAVAVIVARSVREARDAADLVDVEYDLLPPVLDMEAAIADGADLAHPDLGTNKSATWVFDSAAAGTGSDVEEAIAAARVDGVVVERKFRQQRLIPAFMEPRSTVVDPTGEQITMWTSTQVPHFVRIFLALVTGTPESKIRVIAPDVGGGFGGKLQFTPEELVTFLVARRLGKPVKFTETRTESIMTGHHGRDQIQRLTLAAKKDGTVTGLKVELLADMGAYLGLVTPGVPILGAFMFNGIYKFPAYRFECTNVFTNKTWTDAYRGAGRPEATFAIERMMDELAVELGREPLELREQNWIKHEEFPFMSVAGMEYDSGNYEAAPPGPRSCSTTTGCAPSRRRGASATTRCSWVSASRRSPRCAAWPPRGCWGRSSTSVAAGSRRRSGCCRPARSSCSPVPARTARGTRRRSARSSPTSSAWPLRTSRCCTVTPPSRTRAWTPMAHVRWWSVGSPSSSPPRR